jgi:hypothetical protein
VLVIVIIQCVYSKELVNVCVSEVVVVLLVIHLIKDVDVRVMKIEERYVKLAVIVVIMVL